MTTNPVRKTGEKLLVRKPGRWPLIFLKRVILLLLPLIPSLVANRKAAVQPWLSVIGDAQVKGGQNAIYAICMQQPELARVAQAWAMLSDEKRARILVIVNETTA